jgi:spermidine/putrescine transport system permease protein
VPLPSCRQGDYGGVGLPVTGEALVRVFFQRDIFDGTVSAAEAHLTIFWRSLWLSVVTTLVTFRAGPAHRLVHRHAARADARDWLFLITLPFWTNLLIRTFASWR